MKEINLFQILANYEMLYAEIKSKIEMMSIVDNNREKEEIQLIFAENLKLFAFVSIILTTSLSDKIIKQKSRNRKLTC